MHSHAQPPDPAEAPAAASTASGRRLALWGQAIIPEAQREEARRSDAGRQLQHCFRRWGRLLDGLHRAALSRLAANKPVDPNDAATWKDSEQCAEAVLRRHGMNRVSVFNLTSTARGALIAGQRAADQAAGLDWSVVHPDPSALDERLRRAHSKLPIDLDDPRNWQFREGKRHALARRSGVPGEDAADLSRWVLEHPERFVADDPRCWRIGSQQWFALVDEHLPLADDVKRPIGVFVFPDAKDPAAWRLVPSLSLDMIRLVQDLGGALGRTLTDATIPGARSEELLARINVQVLHAGPKELIDSRSQLMQELQRTLGVHVAVDTLSDPADRWGRLYLNRHRYKGQGSSVDELHLQVMTNAMHGFPRRRFGALGKQWFPTASAAMDLGEAVGTAVERGLPLLLSTEAAGELGDSTRVGRMKGRPGMLSITSSDGFAASTQRFVIEQAISHLRALRSEGAKVVLDAGARQAVRMTLAQPLDDDPVLLGRQREVAALKVVGAGVDASQVGTGKTITTARAIYHRAASTPRLRVMIAAEGRLLGQWREELTQGVPARGVPPLVPNATVATLHEHSSIAGQIRAFDRNVADRAGVMLVPNSILDRYAQDCQVIHWHLLVADEALRYVNPATEAHRALRSARMNSAADCWLLTATPKGKSSEHLDVLVGLAVGDEAMIRERLNTREAGNLMDEVNAHRLRVNFGPHLVRITRKDMAEWIPEVLSAEPIAIEPDSALIELLEAIRKGGQEAYRRLLRVLRELKKLEKGTDLYRQALTELSRTQGVVLGNVGVYVDASIDPETLTHSQASLAKALVRQGLVAQAMRGGGDGLPLLRGIVAQTLANVCSEEQVLVFAERIRCLHQLARTLRDRHGVEAHVADGTVQREQFEHMKARFQAGEFPILCLGPVGRQGHNLQNASVVTHYDLPWVTDSLEQRVGRVARPGAAKDYVQTYIPYIKRAGIEHVVSILAERSAEHHQILDSFEGVKACESTVANQLGAITTQVADSKEQAGYAGTAAKLRVAAAVFGQHR